MIILDTDCLSLLERGGPGSDTLISRLNSSVEHEIATTIITFEEQMRGWLALVASKKNLEHQILAYDRLARFLENYRSLTVLPFEEVAAIEFRKLKAAKIRVGTMDLKIASIAIAHDSLLITRNTSDFELVPRLRFADWTV